MSMGLRNVCLLAGCTRDPLGRLTEGVSMQGALEVAGNPYLGSGGVPAVHSGDKCRHR